MFVVVDVNCSPILGLSTCYELGLAKRSSTELIQKHPQSVNSLVLSKNMLHSVNRNSHELSSILTEFSSLFNGGVGNIPTQDLFCPQLDFLYL